MSAILEIELSASGSTARLDLRGEFDLAGEAAFSRELERALSTEPSTVVVNLSRLRFFDSSGLRALLAARSLGAEAGWELVITSPSPPVERVLQVTETRGLFTVVEHEAAAPLSA